MSTPTTLCLGHDRKDKEPNGCERANTCKRHLAFRSQKFPEYDTIVGCACVKAGFPLYEPGGDGAAHA